MCAENQKVYFAKCKYVCKRHQKLRKKCKQVRDLFKVSERERKKYKINKYQLNQAMAVSANKMKINIQRK